MSHEATELYLYITNDSSLYRQMMVPIQKNYMLKRKKGIFDKERAVTGFMYLAEEGARHYIKEFGSPGDNIATMFPKSVRLEVARELTDRFIAEADLGNYDYLLEKPKKNPALSSQLSMDAPKYTKTSRLDREKLYVIESQFKEYVENGENWVTAYHVVSPFAYKPGYFPKAYLLGEYVPDARDRFVLAIGGYFALEREPHISGTELKQAMASRGVYTAYFIQEELQNPRRALTADRVAEIAESFVNGNISWVREQIAGNLENFINVQAYIAQNFPDSSESFQRLVVKENPRQEIVIKIYNGIVDDVKGLPRGWTYEVVDFDDLGSDAGERKMAAIKKENNNLGIAMKSGIVWNVGKLPAGYKYSVQEENPRPKGKGYPPYSLCEDIYNHWVHNRQLSPQAARRETIKTLATQGYDVSTIPESWGIRLPSKQNPRRASVGRMSPMWSGAKYATYVQQFPTGRWGVVGSCPITLASRYFDTREEVVRELENLGYVSAGGDKFDETQTNPAHGKLFYEINPNYWNVPLLIQDLRAMGVKFKVVERGRLRTDIIPATEQDYHSIWAIHHDSGRDYRRIGVKSFTKSNPRGRPKTDHSNWKVVISSAPPYYTPDGFVLFHDEHGNRNKARMEDFKDITSAEDRVHGQHRFEVRNVRGKSAPKRKFEDRRHENPRYHDKVSIDGVVYYIDRDNLRLIDAHTRNKAINFDSKLEMQEYLSTGGIATFPMRKGGQEALKKELTKKLGAERWVKCTHCGSSFTIRFHGRGPRAKRYMKNCPDCGGLIEVKGG